MLYTSGTSFLCCCFFFTRIAFLYHVRACASVNELVTTRCELRAPRTTWPLYGCINIFRIKLCTMLHRRTSSSICLYKRWYGVDDFCIGCYKWLIIIITIILQCFFRWMFLSKKLYNWVIIFFLWTFSWTFLRSKTNSIFFYF